MAADKKPGFDAPEGMTVHVYDDIVEHDNHLPNWWLYTLYGAIVFALGYWIYFHGYGVGKSPLDKYRAQRAADARAEDARLAADMPTDEKLLALAADAKVVEQGKSIFAEKCVSCHRADGGGMVGPNLTDSFWLHGGSPTAIHKIVAEGFVEKGMLAWRPQIGEQKVRAVTAYVLTLRNTNVAGGKEPQGTKDGEGPAPAPAGAPGATPPPPGATTGQPAGGTAEPAPATEPHAKL
jgi:cytochrome c oxidase cbb3-type subunit 3